MEKSFVPALSWRWLTPYYERLAAPLSTRIWRRVANAVANEMPKNATAIDLCCGPGTVLRFIRDLRPDLRLRGADIDPEMILQARAKDTSNMIEFQCASIDALPFSDGSADVVVSSLAFHHLPMDMKPRAFREIRRILKSGGVFFLCDFSLPHCQFLIPFVELYLKHHATTGPQLRGQLLELAANQGAKIETLWQLYGCISLHRITFPVE